MAIVFLHWASRGGAVLFRIRYAFTPTTSLLCTRLLSGFAIAIGYGIGVAGVLLYQFLELRNPSDRLELWSKRVTTVAVALVFVWFVWQMTFWQNSIRSLMNLPELETGYPYRMAAIAW